MAYNRMGQIHNLLGRPDQAVEHYKKAIEHQERLVAEFPKRPEYRTDLALSYHDFAMVQDNARAEKLYRAAIHLWEPLAVSDPAVRVQLGNTYCSLGICYLQRRDFQSAEAHYLKSRKIRAKLAEDQTPEKRAALAMTDYDLALLHLTTGRQQEAETEFRRCAAVWEPLATDERWHREYQRSLAECYNSLGHILTEQGRTAEAETVLLKALKLRERLARLFPGIPGNRENTARAHHMLAALFQSRRSTSKAIDEYLRAVAIREALAEEFPNEPAYLALAAESLQNLGLVYHSANEFEKAEAAYRKALKLLEPYGHGGVGASRFPASLGAVYINLGTLCQKDRPQEALIYHDRAVATFEPMLREHPEDSGARTDLINAFGARANTNTALGRHGESLADWEQVIALSKPEAIEALRFHVCLARARAGDHARASSELAAWAKGKKTEAADLYNFACIYSLCSAAAQKDSSLSEDRRREQSNRYAETALNYLEQSRAAGMFQTQADQDLLRTDSDLEAVRTRVGLPSLLNRLKLTPVLTDSKPGS
jgi:tetratricopeptide (TPR) repeat protein